MNINKTVILAVLLSGCASVPDVTYNYYPIRWNSSVTVTQTIGCTALGDNALVMHAFSVGTTYSSNLDKPPFSIRIKDLERLSSDVDFTMTLTDDGRLRGINQSSTGQGEAIVKSAISVGTALTSLPLMQPMVETAKKTPSAKDCNDIDKWGDKKPITLIYRASFNDNNLGDIVILTAAPESKALYEKFNNFLPKFSIYIDKKDDVKEVSSKPLAITTDTNVVPLTLQKLGSVGIKIRQNGDGSDKPAFSSRILTPLNETYTLPIPKAALFGKQSFSLTLSDSGAVTSIGYGKNTGTIGALNALGALLNTQTVATEASEAKAQADLIAQQQRLVLCMTKPDQCK